MGGFEEKRRRMDAETEEEGKQHRTPAEHRIISRLRTYYN